MQTTLVKSGFDLSKTLIEYLSKDAIGSSFLNEYLLGQAEHEKKSQLQQESLQQMIKSSSKMEEDTKELSNNAGENIARLEGIYAEITYLKESVEKIEAEHKKYVTEFKRLIEQTHNINNFIGNIQNISEQTNLLSFNASIEAAHAGSAGAGFRIIANEVKKLSDDTKRATEEILKNVGYLQTSIQDLEKKTHQNTENLEALYTKTGETLEKFSNVKNQNSSNNENVERISSGIVENVKSISGIIDFLNQYEQENKEKVKLFADCASKNQMLFNDLYSLAYEFKAIFEDLKKLQN